MNNALCELSKLDRNEFENLNEYFNSLKLKKMKIDLCKSENEAIEAKEFAFKSTKVEIKCRNCSKTLFAGSDLVFREPSYYSTNLNFIKNLITCSNDKYFYCSDKSCSLKLGQVVSFRKQPDMYMILIEGIKFKFPNESSYTVKCKSIFFSIILDFNIIYNYIFINIAKWSKVTELFDIKKI